MKNTTRLSGCKRLCKTLTFKIALFVVVSPCLMTGCDGFTEVGLPASQLTAAAVFEDKATANAAMVEIYSKIRDNGLLTGSLSGLSSQLGLYADELALYGGEVNFYNNALLPSGSEVAELWNSSYNQIYAANAVVEGVENSVSLTTADRDQLKGEALFVRALLHFYLMNSFGAIPYVRTTDYEQNSVVKRLPENEVYALLKVDLEEAIALLPEDYVSAERVRPNKWTAEALLARVNLYAGAWDEASNAASAVLNQTGLYVWEADLDKIFLKESTTTIWQLMPRIPGDNTLEAATFSFVSGPPPLSALSNTLMEAFTADDQRKVHWTTAITDGTDVWYHASKYKAIANTGSAVEYPIVFRLAEQYLIRAEARAHQGDLIGAKEDLNKIRQTAGLADTEAITAAAIIEAVIAERRLELFTEFGHRFFDLKRTGKLEVVLSPQKAGWNVTDRNFPIPESELLLNPNLAPQNDGY
ncbi:RagB/SusD family nutrient uptake outer membrane protein [Flavobacterium sp. N3904]|uniref:RagB/SusD family nutrient uptake outer membrane protein n=1 Tax=Flavobacterium sp. N3904 TaxID=2986835 RepID=UPI002224B067|nr:RagB/SusD family nutrient uptake outer membrane protein [Flavobacterium sp. N3904]